MSEEKEYKFDWKFYLLAILFILILVVVFSIVKKRIEIARGKDVQKLLIKSNLSSDEEHRKRAKNYVKELRKQYKLTQKETERAEEIFERAFKERIDIWIEDRLNAKPSVDTEKRQKESWQKHKEEFNDYLESIGKLK